MTPLAPWTYALRNPSRVTPQLTVAVLVVSSVVLLLSVLRGFYETSLVYIREYQHLSVLQTRGTEPPSPELVRALSRLPPVERVLRIRWMAFPVHTPVGPWKTSACAVPSREAPYLVHRLGNRLVAGRLPRGGTHEVAIHERYARINGWFIGTAFGRAVDPERYPAPAGRFVVVGLLAGPTPTAVFSYEFVSDPARYPHAPMDRDRLLLVARPGQRAAMNAALHQLPERGMVFDHEWMKGVADRMFGPFLLGLRVLALLLMAVSLLVMGLLSHLDLRRRVDELAVLLVLGRSPGSLLRRGVLEGAGLLAAGWGLGVLGAQLMLYLLHRLVMAPRGFLMPLGQAEPILLSLALPAVGVLVGLFLTRRRLRRMDPIRVIERRR